MSTHVPSSSNVSAKKTEIKESLDNLLKTDYETSDTSRHNETKTELEDLRTNLPALPENTFPERYYPLLAKLTEDKHESLSELTNDIYRTLFPSGAECSALLLAPLRNAIASVASRKAYGYPKKQKTVANDNTDLEHKWIWEMERKYLESLPKDLHQKIKVVRQKRRAIHGQIKTRIVAMKVLAKEPVEEKIVLQELDKIQKADNQVARIKDREKEEEEKKRKAAQREEERRRRLDEKRTQQLKKEEEKRKKEEERKRKKEEERHKKEEEKRKREEEKRKKGEEKRKKEEEKRKAEVERKRKKDEEKRKKEEGKRKAEVERKRKKEEEKKRKKEEEEERKNEEDKRKREERKLKKQEEERKKEEDAEGAVKATKQESKKFMAFFSPVVRKEKPAPKPEQPARWYVDWEIPECTEVAWTVIKRKTPPSEVPQFSAPDGKPLIEALQSYFKPLHPTEVKLMRRKRVKLLQFYDSYRPAFYGFHNMKSALLNGRRPFGKESQLNYTVDSDDEWEEEGEGIEIISDDDDDDSDGSDMEDDEFVVADSDTKAWPYHNRTDPVGHSIRIGPCNKNVVFNPTTEGEHKACRILKPYVTRVYGPSTSSESLWTKEFSPTSKLNIVSILGLPMCLRDVDIQGEELNQQKCALIKHEEVPNCFPPTAAADTESTGESTDGCSENSNGNFDAMPRENDENIPENVQMKGMDYKIKVPAIPVVVSLSQDCAMIDVSEKKPEEVGVKFPPSMIESMLEAQKSLKRSGDDVEDTRAVKKTRQDGVVENVVLEAK